MPVVALKPYQGEVKDRQENFHGNQLLYVGWEDHLMFCAPLCFMLPPDLRFGDLPEQILPGAYGAHPDWARVDWSEARWFRSGRPWQPDFHKTLAENGLGHKEVLRFQTPGLTGIAGSCS